jgi:hypothetical protein
MLFLRSLVPTNQFRVIQFLKLSKVSGARLQSAFLIEVRENDPEDR